MPKKPITCSQETFVKQIRLINSVLLTRNREGCSWFPFRAQRGSFWSLDLAFGNINMRGTSSYRSLLHTTGDDVHPRQAPLDRCYSKTASVQNRSFPSLTRAGPPVNALFVDRSWPLVNDCRSADGSCALAITSLFSSAMSNVKEHKVRRSSIIYNSATPIR